MSSVRFSPDELSSGQILAADLLQEASESMIDDERPFLFTAALRSRRSFARRGQFAPKPAYKRTPVAGR